MSVPAVIRIFFAVDLPDPTKEVLGQFIGSMKKKAKSNGIRWSRPENLHITLQFLAEIKSEHLDNLLANVRAEMEGAVKGTVMRFSTLQLLPSPFRPRVIVLGLDRQEELAAIASIIGHGIQVTNYPIEERPFRAHLTLGRIKHAHAHLEFLAECEVPEVEPVEIREVVLFRSDPHPDGSKYTVLDRIQLLPREKE